jgi:hypothetical protein
MAAAFIHLLEMATDEKKEKKRKQDFGTGLKQKIDHR